MSRDVNSDKMVVMAEEKILVIKPGQKFVQEKRKAIYVVKSIKDKQVLLVSENGQASMLIQADSLALAGLEPVYD